MGLHHPVWMIQVVLTLKSNYDVINIVLNTNYLIHTPEVWTESAMAAEDLFVNNGSDGQAVEAVRERLK
jgi:hypothetical protein